ncbi:MAG: 2-C-methyl-D-erythritol 2,4-cyclodiphosphate synthase [Treponema sp.]|jgi:2-C-methyl-D-erythritol 2,4-cyclodiphosphate synthase/2-C-methyl-D-erythritol 4-phosphate cytidylyltransferase/2-C-methyl-D-erythritol 2,4-cyclodiphosphate synthase|nr:2-C-methyl-D-erythritol 2,4-cyclodiphosphate synthase [Treponema sp.]
MIKIGLGWDLHRLAPGRRFLLGGVEIPSEKGEYGHSDGDVLSHAIADAVLGAAALGDIGELFPPGDPAFKDADSLSLLKNVCEKACASGWRIVNLDCVVVCEKPKVLPWRDRIRASLAKVLDIPVESVFVKGKTGEGLGEIGAGNAVEATAAVLLERINKEGSCCG